MCRENAREREKDQNLLIFNVTGDDKFNENLFNNVIDVMKKANVIIPEIVMNISRVGKISKNNNNPRQVKIKLIAPRYKKFFFQNYSKFQESNLNIKND